MNEGLWVKIGADMSDYIAEMNRMMTKTQEYGKKMQKLGGQLTKYVSLPFAGLGAVALKTSAEFESVEVALGTILKDGDKAKSLFKEWQAFSASTPLQLSDISKAGKSLLAFGVGAEDVTEKLRQIGDVSSGISAPIGEIAEIYGKARVQGRLFAEDINQLTGRGVPIIQELAKQFGVADSAIKEMVADGLVGFEHIETAFMNMTSSGGQFEGMMARQAETLGGLWSTMKDNLTLGLREIGDEMVKAFNLKENMKLFIDWIKGAVDWFKQLSPEVKKTIIVVAGLVAAAGPLIAGLGFFVSTVLPALSAGLSVLGGLFAALVSPIGLVVAAVGGLIYLFVKNFSAIKPYIVDVINWFIELYNESTVVRVAIESIKMVFKTLWEFGKAYIGALGEIFKGLGTIIKGVFTWDAATIKQGWEDIKNNVAQKAVDMANAIKKHHEDTINNIVNRKPISLITEDDIDNTLDMLSNGIKNVKDRIISNFMGGNSGGSTPVSGGGSGGGSGVAGRSFLPIASMNADDREIDFNKSLSEQIEERRQHNAQMQNLMSAANAGLEEHREKMKATNEQLTNEYLAEMTRLSEGVGQILEQGAVDIFSGFGNWLGAFASGVAGVNDLGVVLLQAFANILSQLGRLALKIGFALEAMKQALKTLQPAAAISAGVGLIALAGLLKAGASSIGQSMGSKGARVPRLANGGIAYGRTLAEVGEYNNASVNPEVIAPLDKLKKLIGTDGKNVVVNMFGNLELDYDKLAYRLNRAEVSWNKI